MSTKEEIQQSNKQQRSNYSRCVSRRSSSSSSCCESVEENRTSADEKTDSVFTQKRSLCWKYCMSCFSLFHTTHRQQFDLVTSPRSTKLCLSGSKLFFFFFFHIIVHEDSPDLICQLWVTRVKWKWCLNRGRKLYKAALSKVWRIKLVVTHNTISSSFFKKEDDVVTPEWREKKRFPQAKLEHY